eukprot:gene31049-37526_t
MSLSAELAQKFADGWIASWNAHDLEGILSHYEDDFEMYSPVISAITGKPSGCLRGKVAVGAYWAKALTKYPDLHFELLHVLTGVKSVTLLYQGVKGLSAEVFFLSDISGKVSRAFAHYET